MASVQQDLVERARDGDREAFAELAASCVNRLHAIARLVLRDPDLAEDAVQETLVRCWQQLPSLREPEHFDAWIHRILMRASSDEIGRRRRFQTSVQVLRREPAESDGAGRRADRDELERGFSRLSVDHRAVVILHHFMGMSMPEVAGVLDIPLGTAKSRYHYAMGALRSALEADARAVAPRRAPA